MVFPLKYLFVSRQTIFFFIAAGGHLFLFFCLILALFTSFAILVLKNPAFAFRDFRR